MKKTLTSFLFIAGGLFFLFWIGCSESQEVAPDFGYDYYPLEIGRSWTYEVDSVIFKPGVGRVVKDTSRSFLREVIVDTTTSLDGELRYITERYYRPANGGPWQIVKVFTRSRSEGQAFQTEDNLHFVKMVFPVVAGKRWDGHVYFDGEGRFFPVGGEFLRIFAGWDYTVLLTGEPTELNGRIYEETAVLQQADYDVDLEYRQSIEKYARGVGLIFRELFIADTTCAYCCNANSEINEQCKATPWEDRTEKGFYLKQTLIAYN